MEITPVLITVYFAALMALRGTLSGKTYKLSGIRNRICI
jgi:hypothetical protein